MRIRSIAWSLAVIALGLFITFGALYFSPVTSPALFRAGGGAISGFWLFPYASIVPVGLLIALRRPANPIGWLALGAALLLGLGSTAALVGSILFEAHSSLGWTSCSWSPLSGMRLVAVSSRCCS